MSIVSFLRRVPRIPRALHHRIRVNLAPIPPMMLLSLVNRLKRSPITRTGGPVLSLTTHGSRIRTVHIALESIARGTMLPSRVILWLDDIALFEDLPPPLRRLQERGLEVKLCKNYGPHTKYYPYLESEDDFNTPLVIGDDDQLYPRTWLERLVKGYREHPHAINCHWGLVMSLDSNRVAEYKYWQPRASTHASFLHFALAVSGAIYPPALLRVLKTEGRGFEDCCPKADDVWLHVQALRNGYRVRQVSRQRRENWDIPGTQPAGLWTHNIRDGHNDRQIQATYNSSDIERLREESHLLTKPDLSVMN